MSDSTDDEQDNQSTTTPANRIKGLKRSLSIDTTNNFSQQSSSQRPRHDQPLTPHPFDLPVSLWCAGSMRTTNIFAYPVKNIDQDADSVKEPSKFSVKYVNDLFLYYNDQEQLLSPDNRYIHQHPKLTPGMRNSLVNVMLNVSRRLRLTSTTVFLSVYILDKYLSCENCANPLPRTMSEAPGGSRRIISSSDMQCIGFAALMIAAKFDDGGHFSGEAFLEYFFEKIPVESVSDTHMAMIAEELRILQVIEWRLDCPTSHTYLCRYSRAGELDFQVHEIARCICERSLMEYSLLKYLPSLIAAAAVSMARFIANREPWSSTLEHYTGFSQDDLAFCVAEMQAIFGLETVARATKYAKGLLSTGQSDVYSYQALLETISHNNAERLNNADGHGTADGPPGMSQHSVCSLGSSAVTTTNHTVEDELYELYLLSIFEYHPRQDLLRNRRARRSLSTGSSSSSGTGSSGSNSFGSNCLFTSPTAVPLNNSPHSSQDGSAENLPQLVLCASASATRHGAFFADSEDGAANMISASAALPHTPAAEELGDGSGLLTDGSAYTDLSSSSFSNSFSQFSQLSRRSVDSCINTPMLNVDSASREASYAPSVIDLSDEIPGIWNNQVLWDAVKNRFPLSVYNKLVTCAR